MRLKHLFPFCVYKKRGKKSIEEIADEARLLGKRRACLIYEQEKVPHRMVFMSINDGWGWLEPEIIIKGFPQRNIRTQYNNIKISGSRKKDLLLLLHPRESDYEPIHLRAGEKKLSFVHKKTELFWIKVGYA
jgi:hypothetical protein